MVQALVLLSLILSSSYLLVTPTLASGAIVEVFPKFDQWESDCAVKKCNQTAQVKFMDLDEVLSVPENLSKTTVLLHNGTHVINSSQGMVMCDLVNVSFIGENNNSVIITCSKDYGLAFLNATNLYIANITFTGCGLSGSYLSRVVNNMRDLAELDFRIPDVLQVGLFIGVCKNLVLENIVVANTSGIGLIGVNILGKSEIIHSKFVNNTSPTCGEVRLYDLLQNDGSLYRRIGGGLYLLYQDAKTKNDSIGQLNSTLVIVKSNFSQNYDCGYSGYTNINFQYFNRTLEYVVGAAGGLSIYAAQSRYSINVDVSDTLFFRNKAVYGSGVHIGLFSHSPFHNITFSKCKFKENGKSQSNGGGGIAAFLNLHKLSYPTEKYQLCTFCKIISVLDSEFEDNQAAGQGGGLVIYSVANFGFAYYSAYNQYNNVLSLKRCSFIGNKARLGSALYASQRASHGVDGLLGILVEDVLIQNNSINVESRKGTPVASSNLAATVDLRDVNLLITKGLLTIEDSDATALQVKSSGILMDNNTILTLRNNHASRGGGIFFHGYTPILFVSSNCTVKFINNKASGQGGAIFFHSPFNAHDDLHPLNAGDCFLFGGTTLSTFSMKGDVLVSNSTFYFVNNDAPLGSTIFGSSLNSCPWALNYFYENVLLELSRNHNSTFVFTNSLSSIEDVSSEPTSVVVLDKSKVISGYPGRLINVAVNVTDVFRRSVETVLVVDYVEARRPGRASNYGDFIYKRSFEDNITMTVPQVTSREYRVELYSDSSLVGDSLRLLVKECPVGFAYNISGSSGTCQCIYKNISNVFCNDEDVTLTVIGDTWLGCLGDSCLTFGEMVTAPCQFSYCSSDNVTFDANDTSNQCKSGYNRKGVLCGKCREGYDISFGSKCKKCDTSALVQLAFVFIEVMMYFLVISLLKVTVDTEWLNIAYFFSTTVFPYKFLGNRNVSNLVNTLYLVRLISRQRFTENCYYYGLSPIHRSAVSFFIPVLLIIVLVVLTLASQYSTFLSKHFSPAKTVMTVVYIIYVNIYLLCTEILAPIQLRSINGGVSEVRWAIDPSVRYFHDNLHIVLVVIASCIFVFYIFAGVILLLFPKQMYKYFKSFYPFLDIIWAPFTLKCRPWAPIRLVFAVFIVVVGRYSTNFKITLPITIIAFTIFLYIQTTIQPFKSRLANILDNLFLCIVQIMHVIGFLLFEYVDDDALVSIISWIGVAILIVSYIILVVTFLWYWRGNMTVLFNKLKLCCSKACKCHKKKTAKDTICFDAVSPTNPAIISSDMPTYSRYRDSILSDLD